MCENGMTRSVLYSPNNYGCSLKWYLVSENLSACNSIANASSLLKWSWMIVGGNKVTQIINYYTLTAMVRVRIFNASMAHFLCSRSSLKNFKLIVNAWSRSTIKFCHYLPQSLGIFSKTIKQGLLTISTQNCCLCLSLKPTKMSHIIYFF